jgi:predicted nucleic acid-binding protein
MSGDELLLLPVDRETAEIGAVLRAKHRLRTPDALQVAAALNAGCEVFLTNDKRLQRLDGLRVLVLDDYDG